MRWGFAQHCPARWGPGLRCRGCTAVQVCVVRPTLMRERSKSRSLIAVACGGTGGHLFPGMAVAEVLQQKGCDVVLLISPKQVDQDAARSASDMDVMTLPAVALQNGDVAAFLRGAWESYRLCWREFR